MKTYKNDRAYNKSSTSFIFLLIFHVDSFDSCYLLTNKQQKSHPLMEYGSFPFHPLYDSMVTNGDPKYRTLCTIQYIPSIHSICIRYQISVLPPTKSSMIESCYVLLLFSIVFSFVLIN